MKMTILLAISIIMTLMSAGSLHAEWLVINTLPSGAKVTVNDSMQGFSPIRIEGQSGQTIRLAISFSAVGAFYFDHKFTENQTIFIDLEHQQEISEKEFWEKNTLSVVPKKVEPTATAKVLISAVLKEIAPPLAVPANLRHESGDVIYNLSIDAKGKVIGADLITECSNDELKNYFELWISKWIFDPAVLDGEPKESQTKIKISYTMEKGEFILPSYDLTLQAVVETAVKDEVPEDAKFPTQPVDIQYYSEKQVDRKAVVFKPPMPGDMPIEIINLNMSGIAEYMIFIDQEGNIDKVDIITGTGNQSLDTFIIQMIKKSYWEPAIIDEKPVGYERSLTVDYNTAAIRFTFPNL
ncbi:MAG: energy transducer TonB [bacterium]